MDALENAGRQPAAVYRESVIYTTLSPCAMCSGAILLYGIPRVVVGENQTFRGEEALLRSRGVSVDVVQDPRCVHLMTTFIQANPGLWNEGHRHLTLVEDARLRPSQAAITEMRGRRQDRTLDRMHGWSCVYL